MAAKPMSYIQSHVNLYPLIEPESPSVFEPLDIRFFRTKHCFLGGARVMAANLEPCVRLLNSGLRCLLLALGHEGGAFPDIESRGYASLRRSHINLLQFPFGFPKKGSHNTKGHPYGWRYVQNLGCHVFALPTGLGVLL